MIHNILTILALSLYTYAGAVTLNTLIGVAACFVAKRSYTVSLLTPMLAVIAGHVCLVLS